VLAEGQAVGIVSAEPVGPLKLRLRFSDGFEREIDFARFLQSAQHPATREFLDPAKFARFTVQDGDLFWGDYELCFPIADLYDGRI
jgi:hypothetical protein